MIESEWEHLVADAQDIVDGTLAWCNYQRKSRGTGDPLEEMPQGVRDDPFTCPCGAATGLYVGRTEYTETDDGFIHPGAVKRALPPVVRKFVLLFDGGGLPELEK